MKAYVCTIGERTLQTCIDQLEKFGFEVILLDAKEPWYDKYKRFISLANEDCIRIDADVIPNQNITRLDDFACLMVQGQTYDFYKNDLSTTSPVLYRKQALDLIRDNFSMVGRGRPETDASRIPQVNKGLHTCNWVVGMHGFFQTQEDLNRHMQHKKDRKQMEFYDFNLATKLQTLCKKD